MNTGQNYIVSAADSKFFKNFCQLAYSYQRANEYVNSRFIFYDLGLSDTQAQLIKTRALPYFKNVEYRLFHFDPYPEYIRPGYMTWSWKPIIINQLLNQLRGNIFWMDSANQILKNLRPIWEIIDQTGSFIPIAGTGLLSEYTMPQTLSYIGVPDENKKARNRAGNTCAFSYNNQSIRTLVSEWKDLCLVEKCVLPKGANRSNHRGDQSVLSSLIVSREYMSSTILTNDEVDISSGSPTPYVCVRNRFPKYLPLSPGKAAFYYFNLLRFFDVLINRIKGN